MSTQNKPLDFKAMAEIAGSLDRLKTLQASALGSPTQDAEIRGLKDYLAKEFVTYGEEFLGCWITIRREYEPALKAIAQVALRIKDILGAQQPTEVVQENDQSVEQQLAAVAAASEPAAEPTNIVQLTDAK